MPGAPAGGGVGAGGGAFEPSGAAPPGTAAVFGAPGAPGAPGGRPRRMGGIAVWGSKRATAITSGLVPLLPGMMSCVGWPFLNPPFSAPSIVSRRKPARGRWPLWQPVQDAFKMGSMSFVKVKSVRSDGGGSLLKSGPPSAKQESAASASPAIAMVIFWFMRFI
jgi:hypothetical protein